MTLKKVLFAFGLCVPMVCGAQVMEKYPGILFCGMSPDGRYLVSDKNGMYIYDRQEQQHYAYGSAYDIGRGNAVSDNGIAVAATENFTKPCYWKEGEWYILQHSVGANTSFAMANGITPDGTRIVGTMDCRPLTKKAWPMVSPVIWILNEDSGGYEFQLLPEPEKDITGCTPQQVSATYISDDGKTVLGQVTDYRGYMEYQIVYRQGEDGTWTYETSGEEAMIKADAVWPPYPSKPTQPKVENYLTQDEIIAFNKANQAYKDSLEIVDLTGKNPRMPWPVEFIKERKAEYDADMAQFNAASEAYITELYAFLDAYVDNTTGHRYEFNTHRLSGNGKYYACNYIYPDPEAAVGEKNPVMFASPIRFEIGSRGAGEVTINKSMAVYSICNDGSMTAATPKDADALYSRVSYVIDIDCVSTEFGSWIEERCPAAHKWIEENMTYEISDGGEGDGSAVLYGTVKLNSDANRVLSYYWEPGSNQYVSYFIDMDAEAGISPNVTDNDLGASFNRSTGLLEVYGSPERIDIYDMTGRHVYGTGNPGATLSVRQLTGNGVYVVRLSGEQRTTTVKILVM